MYNNLKYVKISTIELKRIAFAMREYISKEIGLPLKFRINQTKEHIKVCLNGFLLGKEQKKEYIYYTPKTWKDHFKMRHSNHWLMRRWVKKHPIKYDKNIINLLRRYLFPKFIIPEHLKNQPYIKFHEANPNIKVVL